MTDFSPPIYYMNALKMRGQKVNFSAARRLREAQEGGTECRRFYGHYVFLELIFEENGNVTDILYT
ncbi:hypothetical protein J41TS4_39780 [Paenibacillus apis]|uniref:Uncharacterized protein n=1 Tax=Paenibacillus apis TaxID=1792174 RepID=A0A919Y8D4_9BACL|nr:hypothetical protein J41TS4_39780 [Paenibacillus apis]